MGEQSAARLGGDDYQHLYSWWLLLELLKDDRWESGWVEHPTAGAADDVTLTAKPDAGASRYYQVKWHTDLSNHYSFDSLIEVVTGQTSLLEKLFASWKRLAEQNPVEIWLISNWPAAPGADLGALLDGRTNRLNSEFHDAGERSSTGRARKKWLKKLGATSSEFRSFCDSLRFRLGFGGTNELEERVNERMMLLGLRSGPNPQRIALGLVREWIQQGGAAKQITPALLKQAIRAAHLERDREDAPSVQVWIHGWARRAWERRPTHELDWTAHFDIGERRIPSADVWRNVLFPELATLARDLSRNPNYLYVDFRGKVPLSAALAIGAAFPEVLGFRFRAEQPTSGDVQFWSSRSPPSSLTFIPHEQTLGVGDLLVLLSVTGDAAPDVTAELLSGAPSFGTVINLVPSHAAPGSDVIKGAADAVALAESAKSLIRAAKQRLRPARIRLVPFAPASFCLFLGQKLNALGDIVTYERRADGGYQESAILRTS